MSRDIDARIGRLVMGFPELDDGETYSVPEWPSCGIQAWSPSTDIAHAWKVVERMRELGFVPSVEAENDGRWFVSWEVGDDGKEDYGIGPYADTAPLAICRAALMAISGHPQIGP